MAAGPMALHHLALGAADVEGVARFYREGFSLEEVARHVDGSGALRSIWLGLGAGVLMVERTEVSRPRREGVDRGLFLVAFGVSAEARASVEARLAELGAPVESRTAHTSYVRDPEGNRVAISAYPLPLAASGGALR